MDSLTDFSKRVAALSPVQLNLLKIKLKHEGLDIDFGNLKENNYQYPTLNPVEKKEFYPVSSVQSRLLTLDSLGGEGTTYHVSSVRHFKGVLSKDELQRIFQTLINRHEAFRTSFGFVKGEPVQRIHDNITIEINYTTHSGQKEFEADVLDRFIHPFNLEKAPLIQVGVVKKTNSFIIFLGMHHIIADAIAENILWNEYYKIANNKHLEPLKIQYKDFTQWLDTPTIKLTLKKQEKYWIKRFSKEIPLINLPIDFERPLNKGVEGAYRYFKINKKDSSELKKLTVQEKTTLFSIFLTIYVVFLSKICRQEDIVIGIPVAGRKHEGLNKIIGMFVNTLALRFFPKNDKTFLELLKHVRLHTLNAFENQDYPFEHLVNKVVKKRDNSRNPLFDVFFGFKAPGISSELPKFFIDNNDTISEFDEESPPEGSLSSMFDLYFYGTEIKEEFYFGFTYSTTLFKSQTIERFTSYIKEIISTIVKNKMIKLEDIKISHHLAIAKSTVFLDGEDEFGF